MVSYANKIVWFKDTKYKVTKKILGWGDGNSRESERRKTPTSGTPVLKKMVARQGRKRFEHWQVYPNSF